MKLQKLATLSLIIFFFSSCRTNINLGCIEPEGEVITKVLEFDDFDEVNIGVDADVEIVQSETFRVEITAHENIIERIESDSGILGDDLDLVINGCTRFNNTNIEIFIAMPTVEDIKVAGDADVEVNGGFTGLGDLNLNIAGDGKIEGAFGELNKLDVKIAGDGKVDIEATATELKADIAGDGSIMAEDVLVDFVEVRIGGDGFLTAEVSQSAEMEIAGDGEVSLFGTADTQSIMIAGDGKVRNHDLITEFTEVEIAGDGDVNVFVNDELDVKIIGDGTVCFKGDPIVKTDIGGDGDVIDCN